MLDIPWLINRENINGNMAFNRRHSSEAVHNYYYNYQEPKAPWYQRKRYFYSAILLLAAIVIGAAVTLGVVLSQPRGDEVAAGDLGSSSGVLTGTSTPVSDGDAATFTVGVEIISTLVTSVEPSTTAETTSSSSEQPAVSISVPTASSSSVSPPQPISTGSSLAASYVTTGLAEANRRLIVWQDEDDQLVVHEDADGRSLYRISDKLPSLRDTVRRNTPLSLVEDDIGNAHLFYLDIDGQIRHLVQPAAAYWRQYDMLIKDDLITPHEMSPLSATFHETKGQDSMLVLAYLSTDRQLRLVLSQNPQDEDSWRVHETQGLVVAETDPVGLAMVSGWHDTTGDAVTEDRSLFIAVQGEDEVLPFECNNVRIERFGCLWMNETFADRDGNGISLSSSPAEFAWVRVDAEADPGRSGYSFSFLVLADGSLAEHRIGADLPRESGDDLSRFNGMDGIEIMAAPESMSVFARIKDRVFAFHFANQEWQTGERINTER